MSIIHINNFFFEKTSLQNISVVKQLWRLCLIVFVIIVRERWAENSSLAATGNAYVSDRTLSFFGFFFFPDWIVFRFQSLDLFAIDFLYSFVYQIV